MKTFIHNYCEKISRLTNSSQIRKPQLLAQSSANIFFNRSIPLFAAAIIMLAVASRAQNWIHFTNQNEVRDAAQAADGSLWAALPWGLQNLKTNGTRISYMSGANGMKATDFAQVFALPNGDIIGATKNGIIVHKEKNSQNFETINESSTEKERALLSGLGKVATPENSAAILILPFNNALSFFDAQKKRYIITLEKIGENSLDSIKRVAIRSDSLWIELAGNPSSIIWKRKIDFANIYGDRFLADPNSWTKETQTNGMPAETPKPSFSPPSGNFYMSNANAISIFRDGAIAWGSDYRELSRFQIGGKIRDAHWENSFAANQSGKNTDQQLYPTKSLAAMSNGNFAIGMTGAGFLAFNSGNSFLYNLHSSTTGNSCPSKVSEDGDEWTVVQGVDAAPDFSGYFFSFMSPNSYGLGFVSSNFTSGSNNYGCRKIAGNSSSIAHTIAVRENELGEWELYAAWEDSWNSRFGGVDFYKISHSENSPANTNFTLVKKWSLEFGLPLDFAFDNKGVLWAVSLSKIFYLDPKNYEWKEPSYIGSFGRAGAISALEADANGGIWLGTQDGAYSFSQINGNPDSLIAKKISVKDGLLSEIVYDIAIDTLQGLVYFAHSLGLSIYATASVRSSAGYMESGSPKVIAYPNPFRPQIHKQVTIDNVSEKGTVYILDSSGKRIRIFKGKELTGGRAIWDGSAENGNSASPGIYHYFAVDGKNTAKGKILLEK